jgi:hypothetical protein
VRVSPQAMSGVQFAHSTPGMPREVVPFKFYRGVDRPQQAKDKTCQGRQLQRKASASHSPSQADEPADTSERIARGRVRRATLNNFMRRQAEGAPTWLSPRHKPGPARAEAVGSASAVSVGSDRNSIEFMGELDGVWVRFGLRGLYEREFCKPTSLLA